MNTEYVSEQLPLEVADHIEANLTPQIDIPTIFGKAYKAVDERVKEKGNKHE